MKKTVKSTYNILRSKKSEKKKRSSPQNPNEIENTKK